jgi:hypothetical protein
MVMVLVLVLVMVMVMVLVLVMVIATVQEMQPEGKEPLGAGKRRENHVSPLPRGLNPN